MRRRLLLMVGLLSLLVLFRAAGAAPDATSGALKAAVFGRRWPEATQVFNGLSNPTPEDQYFVGSALMDLHEPSEADPHLRTAKAGGFDAPKDWPKVDALLARAVEATRLTPPRRPATTPPEAAVVVYAGPPTKWSAPVLAAVPEFVAVGRRIFGKDLPPLSFYLFADRPSFDGFFGALFGTPTSTSWQDGTGSLNAVVCCEKSARGRTSRVAGSPETIGCVLHEFGHAWFGTYLMNRHCKEWVAPSIRRPWLDEGMAEYVASMREPAFLSRRSAWLRNKAADGVIPPRFEELATYDGFYEKGDAELNYYLSALLVAELLGPSDRGAETIRKLLDDVGTSGDVDAAIRKATGKDPLRTFVGVVQRFW